MKIDLGCYYFPNYHIGDRYYYNGGPFLESALEQGFLNAPNRAD